MSLVEAIKMVEDGSHMGLGGCHYSRTPVAAIREIIRAEKKNLTISRSIISFEGDWLLAAGIMKKAITSWFSGAVTYGVSPIMRSYVQSKRAAYEEWSHLGIGLRYRAGAMGIPFLPAKSTMGSDLMKLYDVKTMDCPYTGEKLALIPALTPDVAIIHVQKADKYGNGQITGAPFMDPDLAKAARKVILTTEKIVDNEQIRANSDMTSIPFFAVDAVVEIPYGAFPQDVYGYYEPYHPHFKDYYKDMKAGKDLEENVREYIRKYFLEPETWLDYLELVGAKAIVAQTKIGGL